MRIRLAIPDELDDHDRKEALDAALESVTRSVKPLVARGLVPTAAKAIKGGKVRWAPEPPGDEHFDLPSTVLKRGWGDCDDLAPWHAATLRASGTDPGARAIVRKSGPNRWHAIVQRSDGSIEDPSRHAGMGHNVSGEGGGAGPAIHKPMSADSRLCIALCPSRDPRHPVSWFARCDAPDRCEPWDWTGSAHDADPRTALLRSISAVRGVCGSEIDETDLRRLQAVNDLLLGADPEEVGYVLEQVLGCDGAEDVLHDAAQSVGFFGGLVKAVSKPFKPIAKVLAPVARVITPAAEAVLPTAFGPAGKSIVSVTRGLSKGDPKALFAAALPTYAAHLDPKLVAKTFGSFGKGATPVVPVPAPQFSPRQQPSASEPWAPSTFKFESGTLVQPMGVGPSFMTF